MEHTPDDTLSGCVAYHRNSCTPANLKNVSSIPRQPHQWTRRRERRRPWRRKQWPFSSKSRIWKRCWQRSRPERSSPKCRRPKRHRILPLRRKQRQSKRCRGTTTRRSFGRTRDVSCFCLSNTRGCGRWRVFATRPSARHQEWIANAVFPPSVALCLAYSPPTSRAPAAQNTASHQPSARAPASTRRLTS